MDNRAIQMHSAMTRIGTVVESNPALKARASECLAFPRFVEDTREFERLFQVEQTAKLNKPLLRQEMEGIVKRIMLELKCIDDAYRLTGGRLEILKEVKHPKEAPAALFTASTLGYVAAMEDHKVSLIDAGLHPNKFNEVRALVARYIEVHTDWSRCCLDLENSPDAVKFWMERARKRGELLQGELSSVMSKEIQLEWQKAAWLGRSHRPAALGSGQLRALPAPANGDGARPATPANEEHTSSPEAPAVEDPSNGSFGKRTMRAVMRVFGGSDGNSASAESPKPLSGETGAWGEAHISEANPGGSAT